MGYTASKARERILLGVVIISISALLLPMAASQSGGHIGYNFSVIHEISPSREIYGGYDGRTIDIHSLDDVLFRDLGGELWYGAIENAVLIAKNPVLRPDNFTIEEISISPDGDRAALLLNYPDKISIAIIERNSGVWDENTTLHEIYHNYLDYAYIRCVEWMSDDVIGFYMAFPLYPDLNGIYTMNSDGSNLSLFINVRDTVTDIGTDDQGRLVFSEHNSLRYVMEENGTREIGTYGIPASRFAFLDKERLVVCMDYSENLELTNISGRDSVILVPSYFLYNNSHCDNCDIVGFDILDNTIYFYLNIHATYGDEILLYYIQDPTGEWKDSDGDGVWDGVDGAPDDPNEGYYEYYPYNHPYEPPYNGFEDLLYMFSIIFIFAAGVIVFVFYKIAKSTYVKPPLYTYQNPFYGWKPQSQTPDGKGDTCPFCGSQLVEKNGRKYCERCRIYF